MKVSHPTDVWLNLVHERMANGKVSWNEAWKQCSGMYRAQYQAMMIAGNGGLPRKSGQESAANAQLSTKKDDSKDGVSRIVDAVRSYQREFGNTWEDSFQAVKKRHPELFTTNADA